ncbi:glycosyl hydrolase family 28-related protein [Metabacillus idriensis]|uniref:glycosyl hydrolase family 28-related protein n=1 Tax=Metabacillus idriensis TaxID=324768 RepID=UPI003D278510
MRKRKGLIIAAMLICSVWIAGGFVPAESDILNVKDFGAAGDGATNDTAAIKKALYSGKGKSVYFPEGTYLIKEALTVKEKTEVYGSNAVIKADGPGESMLRIYGSGISIHDLTIDGNKTFLRGMTVMNGTIGFQASKLKLQHFSQPEHPKWAESVPIAIRVEGGVQDVLFDQLTIRDVYAKNKTFNSGWDHLVARGILISPAISSQPPSKNITIQHSLITEIGPKDDGDGIVVQGFKENVGVTIKHNTFEKNHKRAVKIQSPGAVIANNHIQNSFYQNNFYDTYKETNEYDMWSAVSVYSDNVDITGNTIDGTGRFSAAIDIAGGNNVSVTRNKIANRAASPSSDVIRINKGYDGTSRFSNISIRDNSLKNGRYGINVVAYVKGLSLSGNTYHSLDKSTSPGIKAE